MFLLLTADFNRSVSILLEISIFADGLRILASQLDVHFYVLVILSAVIFREVDAHCNRINSNIVGHIRDGSNL